MDNSLFLFIIALSIAGILSAFLGIYIWTKEKTLKQWLFTIMMLLSSFWCIIYIFELLSPTETFAVYLSNTKFISVTLIPPTFCLFTLTYTEEEQELPKSYLLLYIIPLINIVLIFTNHLHHLFWLTKTATFTNYGFIVQSTDAAFFWFHTTYSYLLLLFGFIFIIKSLFYSKHLYSKQALLLISGISAPIIGNIIIVFKLYPTTYDITPIFFVITGLLFSLAIFHYQLFSIVPVAREKIIEYLPESIFVLDTDNHLIDYNKSAYHLIQQNYLPATKDRIIGSTAKQVFQTCLDNQFLSCSQSTKEQVKLQGIMGEKIFEVECSPVFKKNHMIKGKTVIFRDITKEKQRMNQIHQQQKAISKLAKHQSLLKGNKEEAFRLITETASEQLNVPRVGIWFLQNNQQELTCVDLYDAKKHNHSSGITVKSDKYPEYFKSLRQGRAINANDALTDSRTREFKSDYLQPLGIKSMMDAPIWVSGNLAGVLCHEQLHQYRNWKEYEVSFAGELTDQITQVILNAEREQAIAALRKSEMKYRTIFENTGTAIGTFGEDGRITMVNSTFAQLSGYTTDEIEHNMHWYDFVAEEDRQRMMQYHKKRGKKPESVPNEYDFNFVDKHGTVKSVHICISMIPHTSNRIFSLIDVTELKRTHQRLQELNNTLEQKVKERTARIEQLLKQKDEFVNQLGHDLKNPLGPLVSLLPIIDRHVTDEKDKQILNVIQRNVGYMKNLVNKTLELARLNSPNTVLHLERINLKDKVDEIIERNSYLFKEKNIMVSSQLSSDFVVFADELRLEELVNNLLSNAVKYNKEHGSIIIDAVIKDDMVMVSLSDDGRGMNRDQLSHVFDEFYKADESRHNINSSGLGMPICKRIVEKHGGDIWVESDGIGQGSTFYFTLPLKPFSQSNTTEHLSSSYNTVTEKVDQLFAGE